MTNDPWKGHENDPMRPLPAGGKHGLPVTPVPTTPDNPEAILKELVREFAFVNPHMPIPADGGKMCALISLVERAKLLVDPVTPQQAPQAEGRKRLSDLLGYGVAIRPPVAHYGEHEADAERKGYLVLYKLGRPATMVAQVKPDDLFDADGNHFFTGDL
jgi:hypothetical protein